MKKILSLLIVPAMLVSMSACGASGESASEAASSFGTETTVSTTEATAETETEPETTADTAAVSEETTASAVEDIEGLVNPVTEYQTMDEMNNAAGTQLAQPRDMEVTNEYYSVINGDTGVIAQYEFTWEGNAYTLRCAPAILNQDISGIYINGDTAFGAEMPEEIETNGDDTCKVARWANIDGQFTLYVADNGALTDDDFMALAESFSEQTNPAVVGSELTDYFASLAGSWQDETSQRATLEVTPAEDCATFVVSWSDSAFATNTWEMTVSLSEDGLLYYSDCTEQVVSTDEEGNQTTDTLSTDGSGYFSLNEEEGKLYWDGAAEENCAACVFSRMTESAESSDAATAFDEVLESIYGINPGSSGSSLRAEEAASAVQEFLDTYGAELTADDYQSMTGDWLAGQSSEIAPPQEILSESMESFMSNGGLDPSDALTAMQNGIIAAIDATAE